LVNLYYDIAPGALAKSTVSNINTGWKKVELSIQFVGLEDCGPNSRNPFSGSAVGRSLVARWRLGAHSPNADSNTNSVPLLVVAHCKLANNREHLQGDKIGPQGQGVCLPF
jgi:hypothetical protein